MKKGHVSAGRQSVRPRVSGLLLAGMVVTGPVHAADGDAAAALVDAFWKVCIAPHTPDETVIEGAAKAAGGTVRTAWTPGGYGTWSMALPGGRSATIEFGKNDCVVALPSAPTTAVRAAFDLRFGDASLAAVRLDDVHDGEYHVPTREVKLRWPDEEAMAVVLLLLPQEDGTEKALLSRKYERTPLARSARAARWIVLWHDGEALGWDATSHRPGSELRYRRLDVAFWSRTPRESPSGPAHLDIHEMQYDCEAPRLEWLSGTSITDGGVALVPSAPRLGIRQFLDTSKDAGDEAIRAMACGGPILHGQEAGSTTAELLSAMRAIDAQHRGDAP